MRHEDLGLVIPYVTEQSPRGERTRDIYSRLLVDKDQRSRDCCERSSRQRRHGPALTLRERGPRARYQRLHKLSWRERIRGDINLRHHAVHQV
jgi:hypothetical protein